MNHIDRAADTFLRVSSSITMTFDVYGHLFTRAEDDLELFDKLEKDLMAA